MYTVVTEGLVLRRSNVGEADKLITILTRKLGKIKVSARGVRRIHSRRSGNVELMNMVKVALYKSRNGYTLVEAESLDTFDNLRSSLKLLGSSFHMLEVTDRLIAENQGGEEVFDLVRKALSMLNNSPRKILIRAYEVKLLRLLGFWSANGVSSSSSRARVTLSLLETVSWERIANLKMDKSLAVALESYLGYYIEKVLEGNLRSRKFLLG